MADDLLLRAIALVRHTGLDYGFLAEPYERATLLHAAGLSLRVMLGTVVLSLAAGVGLTMLLISPRRWIARLAQGFVSLTRNTPTLVQLCCAFLVVNTLITQGLAHWGLANPLAPLFWAVAILSLHKAAFHAEALRAGIEAVPPAMLEAAASLGFGARERLWRVQLPLALRAALPSLMNNTVELVKASSLASAIAVGELTYSALMIWTQRGNALECMVLLLLFYGIVTYAVHAGGVRLERRLRMPGYGTAAAGSGSGSALGHA
ncbi:amino acid ABC transporter permease [Ralstonia solanacearum]|uniref:amino acid ABC transporter permease n=1 Tax=Ralstonia solanacearum TaxID=305 RepID=UPI0005C5DDBE|nr:amino acid ABC transporter permease [Ralstonia solanacearum]MBB6592879.1 amino acid ABC transporter permease [Ralstonia solanacearum]MBB6597106.1 amino acid ABC transporter permease [Ralstonia solanacearum]MDB0544483.1 amino acid ABC transporter permease [Ralstonia solanacearum]MDB0553953.1 amino acid ABC transporter permease [Ralstonia solanacearum]MDB0559407.1 amino acid ABC transporter permease [Ralstonia solanacearum]